MDLKYSILKRYWGYDSFRPVQEDIINTVLSKKDVLALLPTGGGKSLCFQLPTLMHDGLCLVITPLIALMQDQVEQLQNKGIKAIAINSGMSRREIDISLDNCIYGDIKFLYVSPERLKTDIFRDRVQKMTVFLVAVDEAHCISQWGYDFRPPYLDIAEIRELLPTANFIALTTTATEKVRKDIISHLQFDDYQVYQKSFARNNLSYSVRKVDDKNRKLIEVLKSVSGSAIIYVNTRKATKELATTLFKQGVSVDYYHGGLHHDERIKKQTNWISGKSRVMVATNAFGMGIDKSDVRLVIHMHLPQNLESYYQEAGRAGRDEKRAFALIIYNASDIDDLTQRVKLQYPEVELMKRVYQSLANYYKLAVGSGGDEQYDFDVHEFAEKYNLSNLEAYHAIKRLEEEGLVQLSEGYYAPSRVNFAVDNKTLYEFQIANGHYDPIIKALLRLYGGEMFTNFLKISESQLAKFLTTDETSVTKALEQLQSQGILVYDSKKDQPQILFVEQRHAIDHLPLNYSRLKDRESTGRHQMKRMIDYVLNKERCRTAQLLDYFDEIDYDICGVCDVCIEKKRQNHDYELNHYHDQIKSVLADKILTIDELTALIDPVHSEEFLEVIRQMVDAGELKYDESWRLSLGNS